MNIHTRLFYMIISLGFLTGIASSASADIFSLSVGGPRGGFGISIGSGHGPVPVHRGHGFRRGHPVRVERVHRHHGPIVRPVVHVCYRRPVVETEWVPPIRERVVVGYDRCGDPVVESRIVSPGHYVQRVVRYETCGHLH